MGKVARRLAALIVVSGGCSFESAGTSGSGELGSTAGEVTTGDASDGSESGTDGGTASGGGSTSALGGSTSVGNDEECVDACAPAVPAGWNGPLYVVDAANPIECPAGFAQQDIGFRGLTANPSACSCACIEGAGSCRIDFELSIDPICLAPPVSDVLGDGACLDYGAAGQDIRMIAELVGAPVSCAPDLAIATPDPIWETTSTLCVAPARGGDCGADVCIAQNPEGFSTQVCISSDGDVECPAGDYGARTVVYRGLDDQRTCEGCACSGPDACVAQAAAYNLPGCSGTPENVPFSACTDISVSGFYSVGGTVNNGTCGQATVANPVGQATPAGPVTLCCES